MAPIDAERVERHFHDACMNTLFDNASTIFQFIVAGELLRRYAQFWCPRAQQLFELIVAPGLAYDLTWAAAVVRVD